MNIVPPRPPPIRLQKAAANVQEVSSSGSDYGKPIATLYIRNLNEKINLKVLKNALRGIFQIYGQVREVLAWRNIRMRGQAFVVFADVDQATAALAADGFPLFGKQMQVRYAASDTFHSSQSLKDGDQTDHQKRPRPQQSQKQTEQQQSKFRTMAEKARLNGLAGTKRQQLSSAAPTSGPMVGAFGVAGLMAPRPPSFIVPGSMRPTYSAPQPVMVHSVPDELLPPNKILYLQNLPTGATQNDIQQLFESISGFFEVRLVPGRHDIAFVEFDNEQHAAMARNSQPNGLFNLKGQLIKATFARK
ncbi:hypothetical protein MIR68_005869 [Amoeboaphelidium protococcarum]|nr:hypothetical protein MIR68_005869 [Amoeboaphelidium protococcarum]